MSIIPYSNSFSSILAYGTAISSVYAFGDLVWSADMPTNMLCFKGTETFTLNATAQWDGIVEYSMNNLTWTEWDGTTTPSTTTLYLRGTGNTAFATGTFTSELTRFTFYTSGQIYSYGRLDYLLDYQTIEDGGEPEMGDYGFYSMFSGCTSLVTAPALPATTLTSRCYQSLFASCTALVIPPDLPATTLAEICYYDMFKGCTSLKVSETQVDTYTKAWSIPSAGTIESEPSLWYTNMIASTGGTFTDTVSINTTYYLDVSAAMTDDVVLEYLHIDNGYFDTEYCPTENLTTVLMNIAIDADQPYKDSTYSYVGVFGTRNNNSCTYNCFGTGFTSTRIRADFISHAASSGAEFGIGVSGGTFFKMESEISGTTTSLYIDDVLALTSTTTGSDVSSKSLLIANFRNGSSLWGNCCMSIGYFNIRENDETLKAYVPVVRHGDGVICLKDTKDGTYLEAIGGTVTAGPVAASPIYTELEYIEGTGTQYIDTGMTISEDTPVEFAVSPCSYTSTYPVFGARNSSSSVRCNIWQLNSAYRLDWLNNTNTYSAAISGNGEKTVFELSAGSAILNGVEYTGSYVSNTTVLNCYLFYATDNAGAITTYDKYKGYWYYYKRWNLDKTELVQDMIPVRLIQAVDNGSIGDIGMWDLVTDTFYPNNGTGTFVAGPEQSEYLEMLYELGVTPASTVSEQKQQLIDLGVSV